jgi:hypothetical protein
MSDDSTDELFEIANAMFSVTLTLFSGLISQGVVDSGKLASHVAGEIERLRPADRDRPYGFLLRQVGSALSQPSKAGQPDWLRAVVPGGRSDPG